MMPVPSHLRACVVPHETAIDEEPLRADVRCPCGTSEFELLYPGHTHEFKGELIPCVAHIGERFFLLLGARCAACSREHLLLDADFHGWNGFVCHDPEQAAVARPPLQPWQCRSCQGTRHTGVIGIQTQGKDDFIIEAGSEFDVNRWPDAFGWFNLDVTCSQCGKHTAPLVSYETM